MDTRADREERDLPVPLERKRRIFSGIHIYLHTCTVLSLHQELIQVLRRANRCCDYKRERTEKEERYRIVQRGERSEVGGSEAAQAPKK